MVGLRDLFVVAPASSFHRSSLSLNEQNLMPEGIGNNPATALGVGLGVIPILAAADHGVGGCGGGRSNGIQIWQGQNGGGRVNHHNNSRNSNAVMQAMGQSSTSTTACQDCGNQAKKDCCRRRCRTCCKSRGYECSTHVKSTWVPASRRRERQLLASSSGGAASSASVSLSAGCGVKKPRLVSSNAAASHTSNSNSNTPPRSFETTSFHQDASFKETLPGQILAPATFKCVKVTSIDHGDDEFAYQAAVRIGGHVFKGFLCDQGEEAGTSREHHQQHQGMPNLSDLHLGGGSGKGGCSASGLDVPLADAYGGGSTSGGGSVYGNPVIN